MNLSRDEEDTLSSNLALSERKPGHRAWKAATGITNLLWAKLWRKMF